MIRRRKSHAVERSQQRGSIKRQTSPCLSNNSVDDECAYCLSPDDDDQMLLCDKCDRGFHMFCLRPILVSIPEGDWFCPDCSKKKKVLHFPLVQKKIVDFFKIEKPLKPISVERKVKRQSSLTLRKKSRFLRAHKPAPDVKTRMRHLASLATALSTVGAKYTNDLKYTCGVPESSNNPQLEVTPMQEMSKEDMVTYELCRDMCRRGEVPPFMVRLDPYQGFVVEADAHIPDFTIITEYVGEVDLMWKRESDPSDSIMTLITTKNPKCDLIICPNKWANLARFLSGINNTSPESRRKINVRSVRYNINGRAHVLLVAIRAIKKGERLYYDYNGLLNEYPTHNFE